MKIIVICGCNEYASVTPLMKCSPRLLVSMQSKRWCGRVQAWQIILSFTNSFCHSCSTICIRRPRSTFGLQLQQQPVLMCVNCSVILQNKSLTVKVVQFSNNVYLNNVSFWNVLLKQCRVKESLKYFTSPHAVDQNSTAVIPVWIPLSSLGC